VLPGTCCCCRCWLDTLVSLEFDASYELKLASAGTAVHWLGSDTSMTATWSESETRASLGAGMMCSSELKNNIELRTNHIQKMSMGRLKCRIPFEEWFDSEWAVVPKASSTCYWQEASVPLSSASDATVAATNDNTSDDNECEMRNNGNGCTRLPKRQNEVEIQWLLGKGGFGKVYVGMMDGTAVAVKIMVVEESRMEKAIKEADIGCHLRHPNIVRTLRYKISNTQLSGTGRLKGQLLALNSLCDQDDDPVFEIWIVQELCTMDTLHSAIKKQLIIDHRISKLEVIVLLTLDIVEALLYLNKHSIIHGDLSSNNVMLTEDASTPLGFRAKLVDFGRAKLCQTDKAKTNTLGTIVNMAPETVLSGEVHVKSDIYSLGILLIELWSGNIPWSDRLAVQILFAVSQGKGVEFPADAPLELKELGWKCLARHPDQRPSAQEVKDTCIGMIDSDIAHRHCSAA